MFTAHCPPSPPPAPSSVGCASLPSPRPPGHALRWTDTDNSRWTPRSWNITGALSDSTDERGESQRAAGGGGPSLTNSLLSPNAQAPS